MEQESLGAVSSVQRSLFGIVEDHAQSVQSLDQHFVRNPKSTFFMRASGEAMSPFICAEDVLIVNRSLRPTHDQVVVAVYEGELICRRLILRTRQVELVSDNPKFSTLCFEDQQELVVWGVVTGVARSLRC